MTLDLDDPRLTAFALGELPDDEREAFARLLTDDPDAQREVEAIQALAGVLQGALREEPAPRPIDRDAMLHELTAPGALPQPDAVTPPDEADEPPGARVIPLRRRILYIGAPLAAVASLLLVSTIAFNTGLDAPAEHSPVGPAAAGENSAPPPIQNAAPASPPVLEPPPATGTTSPLVVAQLGEQNEQDPQRAQTNREAQQQANLDGHGYVARENNKANSAPKPPGAAKPGDVSLIPTTEPPPPTLALNGQPPADATQPLNGRFMWDAEKSGDKTRNEKIHGDIDPNVATAGERFEPVQENLFVAVAQQPLSTFSVDVDTASYALTRRYLQRGVLPRPESVRVEEMINYFTYSYEQPQDSTPFAVHLDVASCPWNSANRLVRVGLKGREIQAEQRPASNLVFLIDVSGSMSQPNKLPLLKESFKLLVQRLDERDRVSIVVYAGASGVVLPPTAASNKAAILGALDRLQAGGSTHGSAGIELAYDLAVRAFIDGGVNRVILATDGDFNVGVTSTDALKELIAAKARSGVFLTTLGFGMGDYNDATMETLADRGNGSYAYIDTIAEAKRVLVDQLSGTLVTIAKDVKLQVEFNPQHVGSWRLVGYSNRILATEDFQDDAKDAGEIGAGHTVTALYEIVPFNGATASPTPLKYQANQPVGPAPFNPELLTVKLRYKEPDGDTSKLLEFPLEDGRASIQNADADFRFAVAVAAFGQRLAGSAFTREMTWDAIKRLASDGAHPDRDPWGYRREFISLVDAAARAQP